MRVCFLVGVDYGIPLFLLFGFLWVVALLFACGVDTGLLVIAFKQFGWLLCFGLVGGVVLCVAYCGLWWFVLFVGLVCFVCVCFAGYWCCLFAYYGWLFVGLIWFGFSGLCSFCDGGYLFRFDVATSDVTC